MIPTLPAVFAVLTLKLLDRLLLQLETCNYTTFFTWRKGASMDSGPNSGSLWSGNEAACNKVHCDWYFSITEFWQYWFFWNNHRQYFSVVEKGAWFAISAENTINCHDWSLCTGSWTLSFAGRKYWGSIACGTAYSKRRGSYDNYHFIQTNTFLQGWMIYSQSLKSSAVLHSILQ